jgi:hypothetical protein
LTRGTRAAAELLGTGQHGGRLRDLRLAQRLRCHAHRVLGDVAAADEGIAADHGRALVAIGVTPFRAVAARTS